jgi:lipid-A-disaccharide synthase
MEAAGAESLFPMEKLSVRGYVEVIRHYWEILGIRRKLRDHFLAHPPAAFIGVDAPDFNLGLEIDLKRAGIPTVQYVAPAVWAWRRERVQTVKHAVSMLLTLFPFEPELYRTAGIAATFVGHPLADEAPLELPRAERRALRQLAPRQPVVALLPGSRVSELEMHADLFVEVARRFHRAQPDAHFLVPLVNRETRVLFEAALYRPGAAEPPPMTLLYGHADDAFAAADVALVASGTATLEAALYRCPHVITYKVTRQTARWVRSRLRVPWVGLPNVLAQQFIVPELLQEDATGETLAQALLNLFEDRSVRERLVRLFERMHHALRQGAAGRAANVVLAELGIADAGQRARGSAG